MAMYTNIGGTSKELEYLRFNKDGAIQGITDAYANIDANSKKIFGTIKKSYWWKKYPCTEYELVKMAIEDVPYTTAASSITTTSVYKNTTNSNTFNFAIDGSVLNGELWSVDNEDIILNTFFNKTSGEWNEFELFNNGTNITKYATGYFYMKHGDLDTYGVCYSDYTQCIFHGTYDGDTSLTIDYIYYIKPSKFSDTYSIISGPESTNPSNWLHKEVEIDSKILPFDNYETYWFDDETQIYYPIFSEDHSSFKCGLYEYLGYFA